MQSSSLNAVVQEDKADHEDEEGKHRQRDQEKEDQEEEEKEKGSKEDNANPFIGSDPHQIRSPDPNQSIRIRQEEEEMPFERIAFIGAGNMAFAIAQGLVRSGRINPSKQFYVYAPSKRNLPKFEQAFTCTTTTDIHSFEGMKKSDLVFICVKPNILHQPLIRFTHDPLVISLAAGISINNLKQSVIAPAGQFVRIMTNTACAIGASVCATHIDPLIEDDDLKVLQSKLTSLLTPLGEVHFVEEGHLNTITGLAGSGPAFGLMFIQAMADGGVKMGLPRHLSQRLAALTLSGASSMLLQSGNEHPIALRDKVCSPGGTTIHGIHALERSGFTSCVMDAVEAAATRAGQLAGDSK